MKRTKIKSIKEISPEEVFAIETTSGTYIADGVYHHNCKYCNMNSSFHLGEPFESEIRRRGIDPDELRTLATKSVKADEIFFLERLEDIYKKFQILKANYPNFDYPDYL